MFNLKAGKGQIVGASQMYAQDSGARNGIKSVMENAPSAEIMDVE